MFQQLYEPPEAWLSTEYCIERGFEVDVLLDLPGVISVVLFHLDRGTQIEIAACLRNIEAEDLNIAHALLPADTIVLGHRQSDTLGCGHGDEITRVLWAE